jgi:hypothetical protein
MLECDLCETELGEGEAVVGYTAPNSVLCVPCYGHLDNEVFSFEPEDDHGRQQRSPQ